MWDLIILFWLLCGIAAAFIASKRGANGCLWFGLGILFGPFGLAMSFAAGSKYKCRYCLSPVDGRATKCPRCQSAIEPGEPGITGWRCPKCHTPVAKDAPECPGCGVKFTAKA